MLYKVGPQITYKYFLHIEVEKRKYFNLKPSGSTMQHMYALPKTHKIGTSLRPFLSMANSSQHKLAHWLVEILTVFKKLAISHSIKDPFEFIDTLDSIDLSEIVMCSLALQSLCTNVPPRETTDYLCEFADHSSLSLPIPSELLKDTLLHFRDTSYRQRDGEAMGSALGPV